jgi:hypothetical protein
VSLELRPGDEVLETACGTAGTGMLDQPIVDRAVFLVEHVGEVVRHLAS